ncbi:MAG: hypothetical protein M1829_006199 [Trizodia sp. TS-e1964]|nr:MAG: hypothetical protein M1829_006199 [Trizodia sp. TS-e1964]
MRILTALLLSFATSPVAAAAQPITQGPYIPLATTDHALHTISRRGVESESSIAPIYGKEELQILYGQLFDAARQDDIYGGELVAAWSSTRTAIAFAASGAGSGARTTDELAAEVVVAMENLRATLAKYPGSNVHLNKLVDGLPLVSEKDTVD